MLYTAKLLPLAFLKNFKVFFRNTLFFLQKTQFPKVLRNLIFQSQSTSNWLSLAVFKKSDFFFEKKPFFSEPNFSSNATNSVVFAASLLLLAIKQNSSGSFLEKPIYFLKTKKTWTFWETSLFHSLSTAKLLRFAIFKNVQSFSENLSIFLKKLKIFELLRKLPISVQIKFKFYCKTLVIVLQEPKVWTFWEILLFQLLSTANLIPLAFVKNLKVFFSENTIFLAKNPMSESFEKSHCSVRIKHQFG